MTRLLINLLPLILAALALASVEAKESSSDPLDALLKPDAAGPLGGTLTGLKYTGFGLTHVKRAENEGLPQFDASTVQDGAGALAKNAMQVGQGIVPAVASDLTNQGKTMQAQAEVAGKQAASSKLPSSKGAEEGLKKAGGNIHVPGGTLSDALKLKRAGPQIDGMDIIALGEDKPPSPEEAFGMVATVGKTAAGTVLSPYLNTVKTGVTTGGAVIDGADQAVGAAKKAYAAQQAQKPAAPTKGKRVYTPALALFPGAGPEAVELGNQIKNTLGMPTPDEPAAKKTPGQKRFHQKRSAGRRHP